jgi:hypothetical protein
VKLPFEFGTKLVFRLVFPGAILAAALAPAVHALLHALGILIKIQFLFPFEAIAWGWAVVVCDMLIYMLFEGRRFWPNFVREALLNSEKRRLKALNDVMNDITVNRGRQLEAAVEYGFFPTNESGETYVEYPTRLGNIIAAYENYPYVKYGLDSIFFWYRLWVVLDKDLREEIDNAQAVVDSTVYMSFALYLSSLAMLVYSAVQLLTDISRDYLQLPPLVALPYVPGPYFLLGLSLACLIIGFFIYRVSLPAHAQFGELFKSIFDQYRSKLSFDDIANEVGRLVGEPCLWQHTQKTKNQAVWRFLRWHRIRDEAAKKNFTLKQWEERRKASAPVPPPVP